MKVSTSPLQVLTPCILRHLQVRYSCEYVTPLCPTSPPAQAGMTRTHRHDVLAGVTEKAGMTYYPMNI